MKSLLATSLGMALLASLGCNDKNTPGGPGATNTDRTNRTAVTDPDNTFRLDTPNLETNLRQGESKTITIGITRNQNFDQDVRLEFSPAPAGLKILPANKEIKASDKNVQVTLEAAREAALGHHEITVTGTPARSGAPAKTTFKVEIKKAE